MASRARRILWAGVGLVLVAVAVGEHLSRLAIEREYQMTEQRRRYLDRELETILATHGELRVRLEQERQRTQELTNALAQKRGQFKEALAQIAEEQHTIRELEARLVATEQRMGRLQGELSLAVQGARPDRRGETGPIQLERVLISSGSGGPGPMGRVVSVDEHWSFVVIDLGWNTVKIGDTVSIFRHDELLAKARVERVQEDVAAAAILPEWQDAEVEINDVVGIL